MTRSLLSLLNSKKSIRIRLFGSFTVSFIAAFIASTIVNFTSIFDWVEPRVIILVINFFIFMGFFMLVFFILMRRFVRYIQTLADGLVTIAKGNLDHRVPLSTQDELGVVAQNINYMADQLQSMMNRERQLEVSKMELITHVSHDLRTPLTSIVGYLNLLKNDDYTNLDEHKRYIHNAFNKTQQLKKLIDDLFDYTRMTSGDVHFTFRKINVSGLLEQIVTEFEPIAQELSLTVNKVGESHPLFAHVDVEKFVRAVDNLLMNALKFSLKPGEITIRLSGNDKHIFLSVENRGKPITPEQEKLLFERFYKAEASRHDRNMPTGAGLGLSIASYIVELHGGRLKLKHENGYFTFTIELPIAAQTTKYQGSDEWL